MNRYLHERITALFAQFDRATLATCGRAGPQISMTAYQHDQQHLFLLLPHSSDHLFNLEGQPDLVLLTAAWKLHGTGALAQGAVPIQSQPWQVIIRVQPQRLHILDAGEQIIETIDYETE